LIHALELAGEQFDPDVIRETPPVNQSSYDAHPAVYTDDLAQRVLEVEVEVVNRFYSGNASLTG